MNDVPSHEVEEGLKRRDLVVLLLLALAAATMIAVAIVIGGGNMDVN